MIGGKQANHGIGISALENERGESDRWSGVAADRLGNDLLLFHFCKLTQDFRARVFVCNHPDLLRGRKGQQARHRLLNHRLPTIKREQLLGALLAAQRPETSATAAGENHGIEVGAH